MKVYDSGGRLIRTLLTQDRRGAGEVCAVWDGKDARGRRVPNGAYLCAVEAGGRRGTVKLTVSR